VPVHGAARQRAGRRKQSGWRPMYFCPHCGNMLQLENMSGLRFFCQTCPYIHRLAAKVRAAELSRSSYTGISSAILLPAGRV